MRRPLLLPLVSLVLLACGGSRGEDPQQPQEDAIVPPLDVSEDTPGTDGPATDGDAPGPTEIPKRSCETTFEYSPGASVASVEVAGEWDGFSKRTPLTDAGSGKYRGVLALSKGDYGYKFVVNGSDWRLDPAHGRRKYVGGIENSRVIVEDCNVPQLRVAKHAASGDGTVEIVVQYVDGAEAKGPGPVTASATPAVPGHATLPVSFDDKTGKLTLSLKGVPKGKYTFAFDAKDKTGRSAKRLHVPTWVEAEPFEWNDGTMYFVFTDRFRNGDPSLDKPVPGVGAIANYQGGDFAGVTQAIEDGYFDKLGVRSLWLSPVNDNTNKAGKGTGGYDYSGYHGYWPIEPRKTDDHFGSMEELKKLTRAAHARGIRVLLDLVQNQVHEDHTYVTAHKGEGWFNGDGSCVCGGPGCSWDDRPIDCWFTSYLPDVNWANTAAQDAFIEDSIWWLLESDADGFRVDAVKHMNDVASTALRTELRDHLETGNAKYYLVGETFTGGDDGGRDLIKKYVHPNALWGQFDFPLFWSIDYAFAQNKGTMGDLDTAVKKSDTWWPGGLMSPFLGNHDVTRFLSRAANQIWADNQITQAWTAPPPSPDSDDPYDRAFLAFAFLLGQPGVPLIYYGDEIGLPGTVDPDNRRFLQAEKDLGAREKKLLDRVRILAKARGTYRGLRRGERRTLHTDGDGYVFARGTGKDTVIIAINRGLTNRTVNVKLPAELALAESASFKDLLGGAGVKVTGGAIDVPFTVKGAALLVQ